ncbi:hypothetical protein COBT_001850 [Conglomerata obtusa]
MTKENILNNEKMTSSRADHSLQLLTIKFLELLRQSKNQTIDLKYAVEKLNVVKRRIYDITNILEGLGMLHKISVNVSRWVGDDLNMILEECDIQKENIKTENQEVEIQDLLSEENKVDAMIDKLNNDISAATMEIKNSNFLYVTYDDLSKLKSLKNRTAFAVKAPQDSFFEGNEDKGKHILQISAVDDKIDVYYIEEEF